MKVGFYSSHLCLRGTTVAIYDYARYNQEILGNESVVFYDHLNSHNDTEVVDRFKRMCEVVPLDGLYSVVALENQIERKKIHAIYVIKGGYRKDSITPINCRSLIHAISMVPSSESHGDVWAYASYWLRDACSQGQKVPVVPYMVCLPEIEEDMRLDLGIPKDALVFGRHGGLDTWNIDFADQVVFATLSARDDLYFLFQNTPVSFCHPRVIHLPTTADTLKKTRFINTCNAMIHARHEGESFGLACAEFSIRDKPILTWGGSRERSHLDILGEKAHVYHSPQEMFDMIVNFARRHHDYNCYRDYSQKKVMNIFKKEFLEWEPK
jgi:hypothetical protein